jgi:lipoyl(octanoyl) transferase
VPAARVTVHHLPGLVPYRAMDASMRRLAQRLARAATPGGALFLLEHAPVFTLGKRGSSANLIAPELVAARGIEVVHTDRGGDITYHGPGQLVAYPVVHLGSRARDMQAWITLLEEAMLSTCAAFGVTAQRLDQKRGIFVADRKIGSVGVRVADGVSRHGLALNISLDLTPFTWIVPCGLAGVSMTSLERESGRALDRAQAATLLGGRLLSLIDQFLSSS